MRATHTIIDSPLGELTLVGHGGVLAGVYFAEHTRRPDPTTFGSRDDTGFDAAARQLDEYFRGERTGFDLPLGPQGNPFELRVWGLGAALAVVPLARLSLGLSITGFVLAALSGLNMFATQPGELLANRAFVVKMGLLLLLGANAVWFHLRGGVRRLDAPARAQTACRWGCGSRSSSAGAGSPTSDPCR